MKNIQTIQLIIFCFTIVFFTITSSNLNGQSIQLPEKSSDLIITQNLLKLTAVGNGYSDQTIVVFIPGSTPGFDPAYDAYKLNGISAAPQLYSIITCCNLAINALPVIYTNLEIQLGFKVGNNTTYSISANQLNTFDPSTSISLEDTKNNVFIDLKTDSVYTFTALTTDVEERFKLHFDYPANLNVNVFIEGPYNGSTLNTDLNLSALIPFNQPFSSAPWNYSGTESVSLIPNVDVVDWILVEVRDALDANSANSGTIVERHAGFLLNDGRIVDLDGISNLIFREPVSQNLFVVVYSRNHLAVMSANPLMGTDGIFSYDFTMGIDQAYGGSLAQKELAPGVYGMIGGDGNADGVIDNTDKTSIWSIFAGKRGYEAGDYNMNSQVNNKDKNELWFENKGSSSQVPD